MSSSDFKFDPWADSYFDRLGISPDEDVSRIRKAGKQAYSIYHPDRPNTENSDEVFMRVSKARNTLLDTDSRREYKTFCDELGGRLGTKHFERWENRDKQQSLSRAVQLALEEENVEPTTTVETDSGESHSHLDWEASDTFGDNDQSKSVDFLLEVGTPKVVSSSGGVESPSVTYSGTAGFNEIAIWGLRDTPGEQVLFRLDSGEIVDEDLQPVKSIGWVDLPQRNHIQFKTDDGKSLTINLNGEKDRKESTGSLGDQLQKQEQKNANQEQNTARHKSHSEQTGILATVLQPLVYIHDLEPPQSVATRAGLFAVWFGILVSPLLTALGALFWVFMIVPFRRFGPWAIGAFTSYLFLASLPVLSLPTGNVEYSVVVGGLVLSTGYLVFTAEEES